MTPRTALCPTPSSKRAYTLIETLLALAICGMISVSVLLMVSSVGVALSAEADTRGASVRRHVAFERISNLFRPVKMILAEPPDRLVLWSTDATGEGLPNLSELTVVEWVADSAEILAYEPAAAFEPTDDVEYALSADFSSIGEWITQSAIFEARVVQTSVTSWQTATDAPIVSDANRLRLRISLEAESGPELVQSVIASRVPR